MLGLSIASGRASGVSKLDTTAGGGDVTAPSLSVPVDTVAGATSGSGSVDTDEGNGTLYWVVTQAVTSPSAAQVKAGQDDLGAAADDSGSQAVSGTGTQNVSGGFSGLVESTAYYAHYMHEDAATNQSSVSSADGFTTDAAVAAARIFDPDSYSVAGTFLADSRASWATTDTSKPFINGEDIIQAGGAITLEIDVANGGYGGRSNVMRYSFPDTTDGTYGGTASGADGSVNIDYNVSRKFACGYQVTRDNQIWWEVYQRFADNWFEAHSYDSSQSNGWYKFLLTGPSSEGGRFDYELDYLCNLATLLAPGGAGGNYSITDPTVFTANDEAWHRFRATMKMDATTGVYKVWIDDDVILDLTGDTKGSKDLEEYYGLGPANSNRGWKYDTWMDVGLIQFWTSDPGW